MTTPTWAPIGPTPYADPAQNPYSAFQYLDGYRQLLLQSAAQRPLIRLWDGDMQFIGQIAQEISVEAEEIYADTGSAKVVIRKDNWLSDQILYNRLPVQDLNLTIDPYPTKKSWQNRWGGKVTNVNAKRDSSGIHTVELSCVHNREHLKHIICQANPIFPPELQYPKMWVFPWNCRTAMFISLSINLARQFEPFLAIPTNIANPTAWIGTNLGDINPLAWPIQPQFVNPYADQSRFEVFAARWSDFHSTTQAILEDAGCIIRAYTFLAGEDTVSPHPELGVLPTRNAIILACENKSGVTGPFGNFTTGFMDAIAVTADDLTTNVIVPQYADNGMLYYDGTDGEGPLTNATPDQITNLFDLAPAAPTVVFQDVEYSGITESNHMVNGTTAKSIVTGGKSPGWVNDLITFGIQYGLSQLADTIEFAYTAVGFGATGSEGAYQYAPANGLFALYQGEFDDTLLAYQRFTDPARALYTGDMGFLEEFQQGAGTAYTISGVLSLRAGDWKTRPFVNYKTKVRNANPYIYGYDFTLGDRVGFQMDELIFVDKVASAKFHWDINSFVDWEISVGTDYHLIDPVSKAMMAIAGIWNLFGMMQGQSDIF
jgi:hypothetical protein